MARTPLRSLTLQHAHGRHLRHLAKMPAFASLETLSVEVPFTRLRTLSLKGMLFNASHSLPAMCGAPWFTRLEELKLALWLPAADLLELSRHEGLGRVALSASTTCVDEETLRALCTRAPGLQELDVSQKLRFTLTARVLEALPPGLRALRLTGVELGDAELALLCQLRAATIVRGDFAVSDVGLARLRAALGERLQVGIRHDRPTLRDRLARFRAALSR
ncbi:MAG: hypothetical protein ACOZQL_42305 [Myxococcota bacterium]